MVQHKRLDGSDFAFATGFGEAGVPDFRAGFGRGREASGVLEARDSKVSRSTTGVGETGP